MARAMVPGVRRFARATKFVGRGMPRPYTHRAQEGQPRIAVLIPCCNEEMTIARVVDAFRAELPQAEIYVYDNTPADRTVAVASAAGAICRYEQKQGKGNVVRR